MNFNSASILWALALLAIPILIHLVNFRRQKKVSFSNIKLLQQIKSLNQRQSKLTDRLLLALRILALLFLIFAFARPYFSSISKNDNTSKAVSIYLDNSPSMSAQPGAISHLHIARQKALEIVRLLRPDDVVNIVTNSPHPNQWRWLHKSDAEEYINTVNADGIYKSADNIRQSISELQQEQRDKKQIAYFISDFQISNFESTPDSNKNNLLEIPTTLVQVQSQKDVPENTYFGQVQVQSFSQSEMLSTISFDLNRLTNQKTKNGTVRLYINGENKGSIGYQFEKDSLHTHDSLTFTSSSQGWNQIELILDDISMPIDDTFRISMPLVSNYKVLLVHQHPINPILQAVFAPEKNILVELSSLSEVKSKISKDYNLIVLDNITSIPADVTAALKESSLRGNSMVFFPSENMDVANINLFTSAVLGTEYQNMVKGDFAVSQLNSQHEIWQKVFKSIPKNVELPSVFQYFPIQISGSGYIVPLMSFSNGRPYLLAKKNIHGFMVSCASDITKSASDFGESYYLLPLLYRLSETGQESDIYTYSNDQIIQIPIDPQMVEQSEEVLTLVNGGEKVIGRLSFAHQYPMLIFPQGVRGTGFYKLENQTGEYLDQIYAVNFGQKESNLTPASSEFLKTYFGKQTQIIDLDSSIISLDGDGNTFSIWKLLIIFACIALLLESLIIRKKH